jgi:hypothetical protein
MKSWARRGTGSEMDFGQWVCTIADDAEIG